MVRDVWRAKAAPTAEGTAVGFVAAGFEVVRVTDFTRKALACRRETRQLTAVGYRRHETDWEIVRGPRPREVIVDAVISVDGKSVWTLVGKRDCE